MVGTDLLAERVAARGGERVGDRPGRANADLAVDDERRMAVLPGGDAKGEVAIRHGRILVDPDQLADGGDRPRVAEAGLVVGDRGGDLGLGEQRGSRRSVRGGLSLDHRRRRHGARRRCPAGLRVLLLRDVRQLVGEQPASRAGVGPVLAAGEADPVAVRERARADPLRRLRGRLVRVDADVIEAVTERGAELTRDPARQRGAAAIHRPDGI